jgi:hypothetical protein
MSDAVQDGVPEDLYGAGIPLFDKLKLLAEWAPLLGRLQAVMDARDEHEQALAIVKALQWAAGKSGTEVDDEALDHIEAVLKTPEGRAAFAWVVTKIKGAA